MKKEEFYEKLKDTLQCEREITSETVLDDLEEWDSLGMMTTSVFLEKEFGYKTTVNNLLAYITAKELFEEVNSKN